MKIYLIRHGQTTGDIEDRYGGDYDDHLSEKGVRQAEDLAQKIRDLGIERIFCSPRIRAQETAAILQKALNCPIEILQDVRERNHYGILTGMVKAEAQEKYPELVSLLKDTHNTIEGGEAYEPFVARVKRGLATVEGFNPRTVAIITHGGPIRAIFREILKMGEINIDDCAFAELEANNGEPKVIGLNGIEPKGV